MTSAFTLAQPRTPVTVLNQPSHNPTSRLNASDRLPVRWRSSLIRRKKKQLRENSPSHRSSIANAYDSLMKSDDKRIPESGKSQILRKLYVDQQTGEMRLSTTDQTVGYELAEDQEASLIRRYFPNGRVRSHTQIDNISPRTSRCMWDQSLRTRSITINSRPSHSASDSLPFLMRTSTPQHHSTRSLFPRISRSAENIAQASNYELTTRYPRGQQRPTGLASGHHALLLRHKEIVEASKRSPDPWRRRKNTEHYDQECTKSNRFDSGVRYRNKPHQSLMHASNYLSLDDHRSRRRCGQEVESLMKANRKCLDWFNTWVDD